MKRDEWPSRPDTRIAYVSPRVLVPGTVVVARTRWGGLRRLHLRVIGTSSRDRRYVVGHNDKGVCHRAWMNNIIHVEPRRGGR